MNKITLSMNWGQQLASRVKHDYEIGFLKNINMEMKNVCLLKIGKSFELIIHAIDSLFTSNVNVDNTGYMGHFLNIRPNLVQYLSNH